MAADFKAVVDPLSCERPEVPLKAVLAICVALDVVIAAVGDAAVELVVPPPPPPPQPESAAAMLIASKVLNIDGALMDGMEWSRQ